MKLSSRHPLEARGSCESCSTSLSLRRYTPQRYRKKSESQQQSLNFMWLSRIRKFFDIHLNRGVRGHLGMGLATLNRSPHPTHLTHRHIGYRYYILPLSNFSEDFYHASYSFKIGDYY